MTYQSDLEYIKRTLAGETNAFSILIERYQHMVYTLAARMLKNNEDAKEVAQDVFVKAFQKLSSYKGDAKFSTWLYRICYNRCLDTLSRKRITTTSMDNYQPQSSFVSASMQLEEAEDRRQIEQCVSQLKPTDALLITLYYLEEQSLDEIATVVHLTPNNVKVKLFRARKKLYEIMVAQLPKTMREIYE